MLQQGCYLHSSCIDQNDQKRIGYLLTAPNDAAIALAAEEAAFQEDFRGPPRGRQRWLTVPHAAVQGQGPHADDRLVK
jgi:hypothetical protein